MMRTATFHRLTRLVNALGVLTVVVVLLMGLVALITHGYWFILTMGVWATVSLRLFIHDSEHTMRGPS